MVGARLEASVGLQEGCRGRAAFTAQPRGRDWDGGMVWEGAGASPCPSSGRGGPIKNP